MRNRILLVDDEPDNLAILRIFLSSLGYEVCAADCGVDALEQVDRLDPDLILLDVMMPDITGYELAAYWKKQKNFTTPIIFLSARLQKEDIIQGLNAGGRDYLTKPFDLDLIEKKVAHAIIRKKVSKHAVE